MFLRDSPFDLVNCRKYTLMLLGLHLSDCVNQDCCELADCYRLLSPRVTNFSLSPVYERILRRGVGKANRFPPLFVRPHRRVMGAATRAVTVATGNDKCQQEKTATLKKKTQVLSASVSYLDAPV